MTANTAMKLNQDKDREFYFTGEDFDFIRELVAVRTGISLSESKRDLVYGRLSRRLRVLNLTKFSEYCDLLEAGDDDEEMTNFVNAITTNLTSFFRENHHFDFLGKTLLPNLIKQKKSENNNKIRIWSAGCSTGEEPYSIAMIVKEILGKDNNFDVRILATDLDTKVLEKASAGVYDQSRVEGLTKSRLQKWIKIGSGMNQGTVLMSPILRNMITFKQLNLMNEWPMSGPFDFIFCRNVVIYFDKPTQKVLFGRYADIMDKDGHLFLGHSETMFQKTDRYQLIGKTIYQKSN